MSIHASYIFPDPPTMNLDKKSIPIKHVKNIDSSKIKHTELLNFLEKLEIQKRRYNLDDGQEHGQAAVSNMCNRHYKDEAM